MSLTNDTLASGRGWRAVHVNCCFGPADPSFEEQHDGFCVAVVLEGSFNYRSRRGAATLVPGAILLGNPGDSFECGHEHSVGDRCLSFHFDPGLYEQVLERLPGARPLALDRAAIPPSSLGGALLPRADAVLDDPMAAEEFGLELAALVAGGEPIETRATPSSSTLKRIQDLIHWIEEGPARDMPLAFLAKTAAMSRYHLLREFKRVTGITPHQFVLSLRLRRAATKLRNSDDPVTQVALEAGFSDLSEFNRRFRRTLGTTPQKYRTRGRTGGD